MVLEPIESMVKKISEISKNPIEAMKKNEDEAYREHLLKKADESNKWCRWKKKKEDPLETKMLENTIIKIGALLALGFGEAGAQIIAKNMQNGSGYLLTKTEK